MRRNAYHSLNEFRQALQTGLPELKWIDHSIGALHGEFEDCYHLRVGSRGKFAYLFCGGLIVQNSKPLLELNSLLFAPLKVAQRLTSSPAYIVASWPIELSIEEQANALIVDLRRLIFGPLQPPDAQLIDAGLKSKLRDIVAHEDYFQPVPAGDDVFEFIIGKGKNSLQIRAGQPRDSVLSLTSLVTNYRAETQLTKSMTARMIFLLNSRLKWARLVIRGEVIEVEVTIPITALSTQAWRLAKQSLYQLVSHRDVLRVVQHPLVAQEAERVLFAKSIAKTT